MTATAIAYLRLSVDPEGDKAGIERQRVDCERLAASRGWDLVDVLVDRDRSASRYSKRPREGYAKAIAMLQDGTATALVVYSSDRLLRQPKQLEQLIDLLEARPEITVATVSSGDYDLATGEGRLQARLWCAFAAAESDAISRRVRRADKARREARERVWGGRSPGWNDDGTVNAAEAAIIVQAYEDVLAGGSLSAIARQWNTTTMKPRTKRAKRFSAATVRAVLQATGSAGFIVDTDGTLVEGDFGRLVDPALWLQVRALLADPTRRTWTTITRYPLTSVMWCAKCQGVMKRRKRGKHNTASYLCDRSDGTGCYRRIAAAQVEDVVWRAVLAVFDGAELPGPEPVDTAGDLTVLDEREAALGRAFADGSLGMVGFTAATAAIAEQRSALVERMQSNVAARRHAQWSQPGSLRAAWDAGTITDEMRNDVIKSVIERIWVDGVQASRTDIAGRLRVDWRA